MDVKQRALELFIAGVPPVQVAATCGVDESYISQLMADEDFTTELAQKKSAITEADVAFDTTLADAEYLALQNVERRLPTANMQQSLQAFRVLNGARRRKDSGIVNTGTGGVSVTVNISMPEVAIPHFITNQNSEIVEVAGKTIIGATPRQLENFTKTRREQAVINAPQVQERALEILHSVEQRGPRRNTKKLDLADLF